MGQLLKQSTAVNITVLMVDSADHVTGKTGLTLTIYAMKAAAVPAAITPTVTELDSTHTPGLYKLALTTGHTDTLGELQLHVTASGADPTDVAHQVCVDLPGTLSAGAIWDVVLSGHLTSGSTGAALNAAGSAGDPWATALPGAYGAGTAGKIVGDNVNATISSRLASGSYTAPDNADIAAIKVKTDNLPTSPAAVSDIPTANANADALLDRAAGVETSRTLRQAMRLMLAAMAGKLSGAATTTVVIRDTNDTKNRISATVDADGNRTAVTYDAS